VVVKPGDHMWSLAKARLRDSLGRLPTDAEISPYWRRVIEANQARIRSGDADLIFPGEVLILPEL
jgi:nucleoid-associated protein YgaU